MAKKIDDKRKLNAEKREAAKKANARKQTAIAAACSGLIAGCLVLVQALIAYRDMKPGGHIHLSVQLVLLTLLFLGITGWAVIQWWRS